MTKEEKIQELCRLIKEMAIIETVIARAHDRDEEPSETSLEECDDVEREIHDLVESLKADLYSGYLK